MTTGTLILIDDYEGIREGMAEVLRLRGFTVDAFADAESALAHARELSQPPELFIVDLVLGKGIDGWRLITLLQALPGCSEVPVLAMSGAYLSGEEVQRSGATAFLRKPFEFEELFAALEGLLLAE